MTLFEAHAGYRPFRDGSTDPEDPIDEQRPQLVEGPQPLPAATPDDLADVILACLEPDPTNRPVAAEIAEGLEPLLARLPKPVLGGFRPRSR